MLTLLFACVHAPYAEYQEDPWVPPQGEWHAGCRSARVVFRGPTWWGEDLDGTTYGGQWKRDGDDVVLGSSLRGHGPERMTFDGRVWTDETGCTWTHRRIEVYQG